MADRIKGITVEIAGNTQKLQDSLADVNGKIRDTQTQLKDVNKLLKLDPSNVELLKQKQGFLKDAVKETEQKLKDEQDALKALESAGNSDKTQEAQARLRREIEDTTISLERAKKQLNEFGSVGAQQIAAVGEKFKETGDKISSVGQGLTTKATVPIAGFFTLAAAGASDLEENLNKVDVAFGDNADEVKAWADAATTNFGLSKNAALEATSLFGDMGTAMGLSTNDAAKMSTSLAGLAGDLSSFKNIDVETAMNALKGVFTGETESLKSLGVIMNQTNLKQFAEDTGLVYDELSQAELVTLRYNYVLEQTKNAAGDYSRTSDGTANSIRTLQATLSNLTAELGQALLPIITPIIQKITEFAQGFTGLDEGTKNTIITIGLVIAAVGPLLTVLGTVISTVGTIMTFAPAITAAFTALTGPIGLAIAIIGLLVAGGVALYENWDVVCEKCSNLKEKVATFFTEMKDKISQKLEEIKTKADEISGKIKDFVQSVRDKINEKINDIITFISNLNEKAGQFIQAIRDGITEKINDVKAKVAEFKDNVVGKFNEVKDGIKEKIDAAKQTLEDLKTKVGGVFDDIKNSVTKKIEDARDKVHDAIEKIKSFFDFKWKLPELKMPHFSISGEFSLMPPSVPHIDVDWYAKAMKNGMILNNPTIFGMAGNRLLAGGEAGSETVVGTASLMSMISKAAAAGGPTINVTVYGAQGQDVNQLADIVANKLEKAVSRRAKSWQ